MENVLNRVDLLTARLQSLLPIKPENQQRLDKKFRLEFNYNSNHMEGNTLTYGETELLLIFDDTKGNHSMREYEEMKAHDAAYHLIEKLAEEAERPLTEQQIKNLNGVILVRPFWKDAITQDGQNTRRLIRVGDYKEFPNSVRLSNGELFEYASPIETPILMQELIDWYRDEGKSLHPVTLAAMLHYKFVRIHPFDDGNGWLARLLMNYVLLSNNLPPVIIKSNDKVNYLRALNRPDAGDYEPFVTYVAEQLEWSLQISLKAAKGEDIEGLEDFNKELDLLKRKLISEGILSKSPKIVYKTFLNLNKVWSSMDQTLCQFDGLFNESKTFKSINQLEEQYEARNAFKSPFEVSDKPKELKIFGFEVYNTDIKLIEWKNVKYGLRGVKKIIEFNTYFSLKLEVAKYTVDIQIRKNKIISFTKSYGEDLSPNEIEEINKKVQKQFYEELKKEAGES